MGIDYVREEDFKEMVLIDYLLVQSTNINVGMAIVRHDQPANDRGSLIPLEFALICIITNNMDIIAKGR